MLIWSFTELGTPLMFNYYTVTPVQVFEQITEVSTNPIPYALVVVMLLASTLLYVVGKVLLGRGYEATTSKASTSATIRRLHGWKSLVVVTGFGGVCFFAISARTCRSSSPASPRPAVGIAPFLLSQWLTGTLSPMPA